MYLYVSRGRSGQEIIFTIWNKKVWKEKKKQIINILWITIKNNEYNFVGLY